MSVAHRPVVEAPAPEEFRRVTLPSPWPGLGGHMIQVAKIRARLVVGIFQKGQR